MYIFLNMTKRKDIHGKIKKKKNKLCIFFNIKKNGSL